jgi:hypothetical protein
MKEYKSLLLYVPASTAARAGLYSYLFNNWTAFSDAPLYVTLYRYEIYNSSVG